MNRAKIIIILKNIFILTRISKPAFLLLYFPCLFSLLINFKQETNQFNYFWLFLLGSLVMRSAGCIINDFWDKEIDAKVTRTKHRPFASGSLDIKYGFLMLFFLLILGLIILIQLPSKAILLGVCTLPLITIYPLAKRFTYYPQLLLGITFNSGVLISALSIKNQLDFGDFILYFGCIFWTLAYDTVYGFMDIKDDLKFNVKSLSIKISNYKRPKIFIFSTYSIFLASLFFSVTMNNPKIAIDNNLYTVTVMLFWIFLNCYIIFKIGKLRLDSTLECQNFFNFSIMIGFYLSLWILFFRLSVIF